MRTAAQVAAWGTRWPRAAFESSAVQGTGPAYPDLPTVSILLSNGSWLDITTDVRYQAGIKNLRRGRSANDVRLRAGSAGPLQINNLDGKYSPRNPRGPLYGLIGRNTQLRISNRGKLRFWGEIPEWPSEWVTGGQDAWVNVTVAGIMRRLLAANAPILQSALTRSMLATSTLFCGWTLEDGSGALVGAPAITGGPSLVPLGSASFASVTDLGGAGSSPNIGTAQAGYYGTVLPVTGSWGMEWAAKGVESATNAMMFVTDSNGNSIYVLSPFTLPSFPVQVVINSETVSASVEPWTTDSQYNNSWNYYAVYFQQSGAKIAVQLYINGVLAVSQNTVTSFTLGGPARVQSPQDISASKTVNLDGNLKSISHLGFYSGTTPSTIYQALTGYTGEAAGRRFQRLCTENSIAFSGTVDLDNSMPMGAQGVDKLVDLLYDCESADGGLMYEARDNFALGYVTRADLYNAAPALVLDYAASGNLVLPLTPSDNDARIINDSTVTRKNGGSVRVVQSTGPMSTLPPSQGGIGSYAENPTVNVQNDFNAGDVAGIHVSIGTTDEQRFDQVKVNVANTVKNHGLISLADQMCSVDVGKRIRIINPPVWTTVEAIELIMIGDVEDFDQFEYEIGYDTVLASPYNVGILDDLILGRFESDGTTLAAALDTVSMTFTTNTTTGELWITTALATTGDFPFDIMITGERFTISGITGVSNPQTWTVQARSVNGVLRAHNAGDPIYLRNPFRFVA